MSQSELKVLRTDILLKAKESMEIFQAQLERLIQAAQISTGRETFELSWDHHDNRWYSHLAYARYNIRWNDIEQGWIGLTRQDKSLYEKQILDPACRALAEFIRDNIDTILVGWALRLKPLNHGAMVYESGKGWWGG